MGAMDDRNKYRRRENGWVVFVCELILFPTVEMTQLFGEHYVKSMTHSNFVSFPFSRKLC